MNSRRVFCLFTAVTLIGYSFLFAEREISSEGSARKEYLVEFQGVPLLVKEKVNDWGTRKFRVYDPADQVLYPKGLPFLKMEIWGEDVEIGELSQIARTDSLRGYQSIEFVKQWQKKHQLKKVYVLDGATTLACPKEGVLCQDRALLPLSQITRLVHGKGFYEKAGAEPDCDQDERACYETTCRFIHQFVCASDLINDLRRLEDLGVESGPTLKLLNRCIQLTKSAETDRISDIYRRLYSHSNDNAEMHGVYHDFLDTIVSFRDSAWVDVLGHMLSHKDQHDVEILRMSCREFFERIDELIEDAEDLEVNIGQPNVDAHIDPKGEQRKRFFLNHMPELVDELAKRWTVIDEEELSLVGKSIVLRSSLKSQHKLIKYAFIGFSDRFEEVFRAAEELVNSHPQPTLTLPEEGIQRTSCQYLRDKFMHYMLTDEERPAGELYLLWQLAKHLNLEVCGFVFQNET